MLYTYICLGRDGSVQHAKGCSFQKKEDFHYGFGKDNMRYTSSSSSTAGNRSEEESSVSEPNDKVEPLPSDKSDACRDDNNSPPLLRKKPCRNDVKSEDGSSFRADGSEYFPDDAFDDSRDRVEPPPSDKSDACRKDKRPPLFRKEPCRKDARSEDGSSFGGSEHDEAFDDSRDKVEPPPSDNSEACRKDKRPPLLRKEPCRKDAKSDGSWDGSAHFSDAPSILLDGSSRDRVEPPPKDKRDACRKDKRPPLLRNDPCRKEAKSEDGSFGAESDSFE